MSRYRGKIDHVDGEIVRSIARGEARRVVENEYNKGFFMKMLEQMEMDAKISRKTLDTLREEVPKFVDRELRTKTPVQVSQELGKQFHQWVAHNPEVQAKLDVHLGEVRKMVEKERDNAVVHVTQQAAATASKMARTDTFGTIYEAVESHADTTVRNTATAVKNQLSADFNKQIEDTNKRNNEALNSMRMERDKLRESVSSLNQTRWVSVGAFITSIVAIAAALLRES